MASPHAPSALDRRIFARYLSPGEELNGVVHRHWVALLAPLAESLLFGVLLPVVGLWAFLGSAWWLVLLLALWALGGLVWVGYTLYDWYCDAFLLTEQHLVLLVWRNLVSLSSERINYASIESVELERHGIGATLLRYGHLEVKTANTTHTLDRARRPQAAQELLQVAQTAQAAEEDGTPADVEALRRALRALLAEHDEERDEQRLHPDTPRAPEPPSVNDVTPPPA